MRMRDPLEFACVDLRTLRDLLCRLTPTPPLNEALKALEKAIEALNEAMETRD